MSAKTEKARGDCLQNRANFEAARADTAEARVRELEAATARMRESLDLKWLSEDSIHAAEKIRQLVSEVRALRESIEAVAMRIGRYGDPQGASGDYGVIGATLAKNWILEALRAR